MVVPQGLDLRARMASLINLELMFLVMISLFYNTTYPEL